MGAAMPRKIALEGRGLTLAIASPPTAYYVLGRLPHLRVFSIVSSYQHCTAPCDFRTLEEAKKQQLVERIMGWKSFAFEPMKATEAERGAAREAWRQLLGRPGQVVIQTTSEGKSVSNPLPRPAAALLKEALDQLAEGHEVAVVPVQAEVTTQEAARIMRVSRPFVAKMIDRGYIRGRKVGRFRRVLLCDALAFRAAG